MILSDQTKKLCAAIDGGAVVVAATHVCDTGMKGDVDFDGCGRSHASAWRSRWSSMAAVTASVA